MVGMDWSDAKVVTSSQRQNYAGQLQADDRATSPAPVYSQNSPHCFSAVCWLPPVGGSDQRADSLCADAPTHLLAAAAGGQLQLCTVDWRRVGDATGEEAVQAVARLRLQDVERLVHVTALSSANSLAVDGDGGVHLLQTDVSANALTNPTPPIAVPMHKCNAAHYYKDFLVLAGDDGRLTSVDVRTQTVGRLNADQLCASVLSLAVTGQHTVACGNVAGTVHLWDRRSGQQPVGSVTLPPAGAAVCSAISAMCVCRLQPHLLVVGTQCGDVALVDTRKVSQAAGACVLARAPVADDSINQVCMEADGSAGGFACSEDGCLAAWRPVNIAAAQTTPKHLCSRGGGGELSVRPVRPSTGVPLRCMHARNGRLLAAGLCTVQLLDTVGFV